MSRPERLALVDLDDQVVPVVAQCKLLKVARSSLYYRPAPVSANDLAVMRLMDELHLAWPFYGSCRMTAVLRRAGWPVNRKRIKRLMRNMALEAIYQKPNTSRKHPDHKVYPYLLRGLVIDWANQVWCADITYIPMAKGFVYLVAGDGLVQPAGPGVASVDHTGDGLLRRGAAGRDEPARSAGGLQHRSGRAIHQCGVPR
jgi:putative transposase